MKLFKAAGLLFVLINLTLSSCKKEDNEEIQNDCKILKVESYNNNTIDYRANYVYTGDKITKVEVPEYHGYYTLEYTGDKITKRKYLENGSNVADVYDQISYNSDGTINKIETFELLSGTTYERYTIASFIYTNGKLSKLQIQEDWGNSIELVEEYIYSFTGNNITSMIFRDLIGSESSTFTFQYNTESNFYHKQNNQLLLIDPFLSSLDGLFPLIAGEYVPLVMSANNMTSVREDNLTPTQISNSKDAKGNVTGLLFDGMKVYGYAYECK